MDISGSWFLSIAPRRIVLYTSCTLVDPNHIVVAHSMFKLFKLRRYLEVCTFCQCIKYTLSSSIIYYKGSPIFSRIQANPRSISRVKWYILTVPLHKNSQLIINYVHLTSVLASPIAVVAFMHSNNLWNHRSVFAQ